MKLPNKATTRLPEGSGPITHRVAAGADEAWPTTSGGRRAGGKCGGSKEGGEQQALQGHLQQEGGAG